MQQLAEQWPLLAGFLTITIGVTGTLLKLVQRQYERMLDDREKELARRDEEIQRWQNATLELAKLTDVVARATTGRGGR